MQAQVTPVLSAHQRLFVALPYLRNQLRVSLGSCLEWADTHLLCPHGCTVADLITAVHCRLLCLYQTHALDGRKVPQHERRQLPGLHVLPHGSGGVQTTAILDALPPDTTIRLEFNGSGLLASGGQPIWARTDQLKFGTFAEVVASFVDTRQGTPSNPNLALTVQHDFYTQYGYLTSDPAKMVRRVWQNYVQLIIETCWKCALPAQVIAFFDGPFKEGKRNQLTAEEKEAGAPTHRSSPTLEQQAHHARLTLYLIAITMALVSGFSVPPQAGNPARIFKCHIEVGDGECGIIQQSINDASKPNMVMVNLSEDGDVVREGAACVVKLRKNEGFLVCLPEQMTANACADAKYVCVSCRGVIAAPMIA